MPSTRTAFPFKATTALGSKPVVWMIRIRKTSCWLMLIYCCRNIETVGQRILVPVSCWEQASWYNENVIATYSSLLTPSKNTLSWSSVLMSWLARASSSLAMSASENSLILISISIFGLLNGRVMHTKLMLTRHASETRCDCWLHRVHPTFAMFVRSQIWNIPGPYPWHGTMNGQRTRKLVSRLLQCLL